MNKAKNSGAVPQFIDSFEDFYNNGDDILNNKYKNEVNFVKYRIFDTELIYNNNNNNFNNNIKNNNNENTFITNRLNEIKEYLILNYIKDYIWQKEPFNLKIYDKKQQQQHQQKQLPIHFYGITKFEESIDDEWFIVYILLELTKKFQSLIVSIKDNDGEFLLIETAQGLPKWLKPTNSKNRVYIKHGEIHIIPIPSDPSQLDTIPYKMDTNTALSILSPLSNIDFPNINTKVSNEINEILKNRLKRFYNGEYFKEDQNQIKLAAIPIEIGYLLNQYPQLISDITTTFYNRDSEDMKTITTMKRFPMSRERDSYGNVGQLITTNIRFTRCLYAMLKLQQWNTPKNFHPQLPKPSHPTYDSRSLGVKIICGLEMVYNRSKRNSTSTTYRFNDDLNWLKYLKQLKSNNYFNDENVGSKLYKEKLLIAKNQYLKNNNINQENNNNKEHEESLYKLIDQVTNSKSVDEMIKIIQDSDQGKIESEDDWLNEENPDKFEDLITEFEKDRQKQQQKNNKSKKEDNTNNSSNNNNNDSNLINDFSNQFKSMLSQLSSFDGVEFNEKSGGNSKNRVNNGNGVDNVSFDSNKFINILKGFTDNENLDMDNSDDDDDDDDYDDDMYQDIGNYDDSDDEDDEDENEDQDDDEDDEDDDGFDDDEDDEDEKEFQYVEFLKKSTIKQYMKRMDQELNLKTIGSSFELESTKLPEEFDDNKEKSNNNCIVIEDEDEDGENENSKVNQKVDLNLNLVKNLLESLTEQQGFAGPASTLLKEMSDNSKKKEKKKTTKKLKSKKEKEKEKEKENKQI
ncbi:hypothetical protein ACTFIU_011578 [Dictyostelium citrinum]